MKEIKKVKPWKERKGLGKNPKPKDIRKGGGRKIDWRMVLEKVIKTGNVGKRMGAGGTVLKKVWEGMRDRRK